MSNTQEACGEIAKQASLGVDFIKLYSGLPPEIVIAAIDCAHAKGLKVIGHLLATTCTEAAQYNIDALAHGAPWSPAYLDPVDRRDLAGSLFGRVSWLAKLDPESKPVRDMVTALVEHKVSLDLTLIANHSKFWGDDPRYRSARELNLVVLDRVAAGKPRQTGLPPSTQPRVSSGTNSFSLRSSCFEVESY